jgi:hypothetical protein
MTMRLAGRLTILCSAALSIVILSKEICDAQGAITVAVTGLISPAGQKEALQDARDGSPDQQEQADASSKPAESKAAGAEMPVPVRAANRQIFLEAASLMEKATKSVERLTALAKKGDAAVRNASGPAKQEIIETYKALHEITRLAEELTLLGELDGLGTQLVLQQVRARLDEAVAQLRPHLGSTEGLQKAAERRGKEQAAPLKLLDDLIKQKNWATAHRVLTEMIEATDEVALFVDPKSAEPIYAPILERAGKIMPEYLAEEKVKNVNPRLREEFAALRPDIAALRTKIASVTDSLRNGQGIRWNDNAVNGPGCLMAAAKDWEEMDHKVAQAVSVLQAIGTPALADLKSLAVEYDAVRTNAITLVPELIRSEAGSVSGSDAKAQYMGYISAIPVFMSALHAKPADFAAAHLPLDQLASRSPELSAKVDRYRKSTSEYMRWRRRAVQRYLRSLHALYGQAQPMRNLLDNPGTMPGDKGQPRVNQMALLPLQTPEFVGAVWSAHWHGLPVTVQNPVVLWLSGADPVFISPWHARACSESPFPRAAMDGFFQSLSNDLLGTPTRAPLTLEAMLAVHTAAHGPYIEVGGVVTGVVVDSLPDRLWDLNHPLDVTGALSPSSLSGHPAFPALVRLQVAPVWLAHDLFVWAAPPPQGAAPPPPVFAPATPATESGAF